MASYQTHYAHLQDLTQKLDSALSGLSPEQLHRPEEPGAWSVIQVLNHLVEVEERTLAYCRKKYLAGDDMPNVGWLQPIRFGFYDLAFSLPIRVKTPKVLSVPSNEGNVAEVMRRWAQHRAALADFLDQYPEKWANKAIFKHPFAGRLTMEQTLQFFRRHLLHHVVQLRRILAAQGIPANFAVK